LENKKVAEKSVSNLDKNSEMNSKMLKFEKIHNVNITNNNSKIDEINKRNKNEEKSNYYDSNLINNQSIKENNLYEKI